MQKWDRVFWGSRNESLPLTVRCRHIAWCRDGVGGFRVFLTDQIRVSHRIILPPTLTAYNPFTPSYRSADVLTYNFDVGSPIIIFEHMVRSLNSVLRRSPPFTDPLATQLSSITPPLAPQL